MLTQASARREFPQLTSMTITTLSVRCYGARWKDVDGFATTTGLSWQNDPLALSGLKGAAMSELTPYQKIMRAAERGTGTRLSAEEVTKLADDSGIQRWAA